MHCKRRRNRRRKCIYKVCTGEHGGNQTIHVAFKHCNFFGTRRLVFYKLTNLYAGKRSICRLKKKKKCTAEQEEHERKKWTNDIYDYGHSSSSSSLQYWICTRATRLSSMARTVNMYPSRMILSSM